jgi:hypothetical protein
MEKSKYIPNKVNKTTRGKPDFADNTVKQLIVKENKEVGRDKPGVYTCKKK